MSFKLWVLLVLMIFASLIPLNVFSHDGMTKDITAGIVIAVTLVIGVVIILTDTRKDEGEK